MGWFILACIFGGGLWGMSRAQLDRNQQRRNDELIDAVYDAGGNYDSGDSCCDSDYDSGSYDRGNGSGDE